MKWHPDRCDNSAEAKERFHQAAVAYKILSGRDGSGKGGNGEWRSETYREERSDSGHDSASDSAGSEDNSADTVFWDVMLDYAIKLAQTGMRENAIKARLEQKGCPRRLAAVIAEKGYNIHAHYATGKGKKKRKREPDQSSFKQERLEAELFRAFIGGGNVLFSPRNTIDYYLVAFAELRQCAKLNPVSWISTNPRLMRILNFSIVLFAVITVVISFFPGPSEYKLLPDMGMLQVPLGLLALMFVWTMYRKLWFLTSVLVAVSLAAFAFFNSAMPDVLNRDLVSMLLIAAACFAPFVFIALFGNYFYFRKAQAMLRTADRLFDNQLDKLVWIKNRAGTSNTAAFLFALIFTSSAIYYVPRNELLADSFSFSLPGTEITKDDEAARKVKQRLQEAGRFFEIAESHFNQTSPDYIKAEMAYSTAAGNGSVLAAYKLWYLYYNGEGLQQSHILALEYFHRAIEAPLAFQPHSLEQTTTYLAEAYNGLGIMYQHGLGTRKNLPKAKQMFRRGLDFGSVNAKRNLETLYGSGVSNERQLLQKPEYN